MRKSDVEIYSDTANFAVIRHPDRKYPGTLIQGDTLFALCRMADDACKEAKVAGCQDSFEEMNELRNALWERLKHYKQVLAEHNIELPFSETNT